MIIVKWILKINTRWTLTELSWFEGRKRGGSFVETVMNLRFP